MASQGVSTFPPGSWDPAPLSNTRRSSLEEDTVAAWSKGLKSSGCSQGVAGAGSFCGAVPWL